MFNSNSIPSEVRASLPPDFLSKLHELLTFKSVSSDQQYKNDCLACAAWLEKYLAGFPGLSVRTIQTSGNPLIFAETEQHASRSTLLIYGHYDVQPPGDEQSWQSKPFQPEVRGTRLYARGARDNKGQTFFWLAALRSVLEQQSLNWNVKVLLDGEEESGSPSLLAALPNLVADLRADVIAASETAGFDTADPAIILGLRGAAILKLKVSGASRELHSGNHGGRVPNPAQAISQMLARLHDQHGKVAVPGFYDSVQPIGKAEQALLSKIPFDAAAYAQAIGVSDLSGESEFGPLERVFFRPTIEIHSLHSGYSGQGIKTSIPCEAEAVISMRLVANQDPQAELTRVTNYIETCVPKGLRAEITMRRVVAKPCCADPSLKLFKQAAAILQKEHPNAPVFLWSGASLPVIAEIQSRISAQPLLVGFGTSDDNEHGFNESFLLSQYAKGFGFARTLLETAQEK